MYMYTFVYVYMYMYTHIVHVHVCYFVATVLMCHLGCVYMYMCIL